MNRHAIFRSLAVLACLTLSACYWGSSDPLMPAKSMIKPTIAPGTYINGTQKTVIEKTGAKTQHVTKGEASYDVSYAALNGGFQLVQVKSTATTTYYVLAKPQANGFALYQFTCDVPAQKTIAVAAGATVDSNSACLFTTYAGLTRAVQDALVQLRANPAWITPTTYTRAP